MEKNFVKADSDNLPTVDVEMINNFYLHNTQFLSVEYQNVKTKK